MPRDYEEFLPGKHMCAKTNANEDREGPGAFSHKKDIFTAGEGKNLNTPISDAKIQFGGSWCLTPNGHDSRPELSEMFERPPGC